MFDDFDTQVQSDEFSEADAWSWFYEFSNSEN